MSLPASRRSAGVRLGSAPGSGQFSHPSSSLSQSTWLATETSSSLATGRRKRKDVEVDPDFAVTAERTARPVAKRIRRAKADDAFAHGSSMRSSQASQSGLSSWISPSFSGKASSTAPLSTRPCPATSRGKTAAHSGPRSQLAWCDKHHPVAVESLAVHRKKVEEVQHWLEQIFSSKRGTASWLPPISLLTGPAGCGKSTTVQVLAKTTGADLHEWQNPNISTTWRAGCRDNDDMPYESEVQCFRDFLLRANKYNSLALKGLDGAGSSRRVLMVEELPNIFYRQPALLHTVLADYAKQGCSPLLFIASDSPRSDISTAQLFPERVLRQLGINSIHFNPVAHTSLVKCLTRILSEEGSHASLDKTSIEGLVLTSCGDIRSAVNSLQFACRRDTRDLRGQFHAAKQNSSHSTSSRSSSKASSSSLSSRPSSTKGQATPSSATSGSSVSVGGRDVALFLFRALGKVLYCKRDATVPSDSALLPSHLQSCSRQPVLVQAEDILEHSHLSSDMFSLYLHQNYLSFYNDIESVAATSDYLSFSTLLASDWSSRSLPSQFSGSLSCRSMMLANDGNTSTAPGWKPLHKPQWLSVVKERQQRVSSGQVYLLHDRAEKRCDFHSHTALYTELLPAFGKLNLKFMSPDHIAFVHATANYPGETRHRNRAGLQALGELDVDDDDDEAVTSSQVLHTSGGTGNSSGGGGMQSSSRDSTVSSVSKPDALAAPEALVALGDDLLTNEDLDALLDFDDDDGNGDGCGAAGKDPAAKDGKKQDDEEDAIQNFSDDDNW